MQTHSVTTYSFNELPEDVQEKVLDNMRNINVDLDFWYDAVFEDAKEIGKCLGIDIENIYFRGFSCQGDGACFTGTYEYKKGAAKAIRQYAPLDEVLHRIADELQAVQRQHFYSLSATIKKDHGCRYEHEFSVDTYVYDDRDGDLVAAEVNDQISEIMRDLMKWIYRQLEHEYCYFTSDELVKDTIVSNDYEFTENGSIW